MTDATLPERPALPPSFETARLRARLPVPADAASIFAAYAADPVVSRYMLWKPHVEVATTEAFVADCIRAGTDGTRFAYVLSPKDGPATPVGMLEARPDRHRMDVGYVLAPPFWGRGYMPEAVASLAALALGALGFYRVQASCDVDNIPSQRTLEKAGFVREGRHERFVVHPNIGSEPRPCFMYARCR